MNQFRSRIEVIGQVSDTVETFSASEISAVTGATLAAVYKMMAGRLPRGLRVRRGRQQHMTRWGAVCFVIDREIPRDVPVSVRRRLYADILASNAQPTARFDRGILSYVVDVKTVADRVDRDLAAYRAAMRLVVEDREIQGGAATFSGTRILVHQIASLIRQGAGIPELQADYPRLTPEMLAAAPVYARAHPTIGRPHKPDWRGAVSPEMDAAHHGR